MNNYEISRSKRGFFFFRLSLTNQLIIINVLCYILSFILILIYGTDFFSNNLAVTPGLVLSGQKVWTIFTSIFMHASFFHIFANMFSLFFLGNFLEKIIGRKRFFWVYILAGIIGSLFFVGSGFVFGDLITPAVGASGALFGLLGILAVLVPYSKIYLIVGPLILLVVDAVAGKFLSANVYGIVSVLINILIFVMIFSLFSFNRNLRKIAVPLELPMWVLPVVAIVPLVIISYFFPLPIGNSAHIGGLVIGLIYGFYLRTKFPNKIAKLRRSFR